MRRPALGRAALACALGWLAAGCATPYLIHMKSGEVIESRDEPDFDKDSGFYEFDDSSGRHVRVNKDQIVSMEVAPD